MKIRTIAQHEWRMALRDRRLPVTVGAMGILLLVAGWTGHSEHQHREAERMELVRVNREQWDAQKTKNPHSAAHYGHFVFRPESGMAFLDRGINAFTGTTIYLEPHKQNNANFSIAQESGASLRLGEMSIAFVLQLLLPLLIIFLGFDSITKEKESQRLKIMLIQGASVSAIAMGKVGGILRIVALASVPPMLIVLLVSGSGVPIKAGHLLCWLLAYGIFLATIACLTVAVSAHSSSSGGALIKLLGLWMLLGVLLPKVTSNIGEHLAKAPSTAAFGYAIKEDVKNGIDGHNPADVRRKILEKKLLAQYGVDSVKQLPVNISGIAMLESEVYTTQVYNKHFEALQAVYLRQNQVSEWSGWLNPIQAMRTVSAGLAGTDAFANVDFQRKAEAYRLAFVNQLNHFMAYNFRSNQGYGEIKAAQEVLRAVPAFDYQAPGLLSVLMRYIGSLAALLFWCLLGIWSIRSTAKITTL